MNVVRRGSETESLRIAGRRVISLLLRCGSHRLARIDVAIAAVVASAAFVAATVVSQIL